MIASLNLWIPYSSNPARELVLYELPGTLVHASVKLPAVVRIREESLLTTLNLILASILQVSTRRRWTPGSRRRTLGGRSISCLRLPGCGRNLSGSRGCWSGARGCWRLRCPLRGGLSLRRIREIRIDLIVRSAALRSSTVVGMSTDIAPLRREHCASATLESKGGQRAAVSPIDASVVHPTVARIGMVSFFRTNERTLPWSVRFEEIKVRLEIYKHSQNK